MRNLHVISKTIKFLAENIWENRCDFELGEVFLGVTTKLWAIKENMTNWPL